MNCSVTTVAVFAFLAFPSLADDLALRRPAEARSIVGQARVIDGDTIEIDGTRIRLFGIDAPELDQRCDDRPAGRTAKAILDNFIGRRAVTCARTGTDRYGRVIAKCEVDGQDLGETMVWLGWARAYVEYSTDYVATERDAEARRVGMWAVSCEAPWAWRKSRK